MLYQGLPSLLLGAVLVLIDFVVFEKPPVVGVGLGIACLFLAALSCVPLLKIDDRGIYVRNVLRRRRWQRGQPIGIHLGGTQMVFTRAMTFSQLVIDDGTRRMRVSATTGISGERLERLLDSLQHAGVRVEPEVEPRHFPRPDHDLRDVMAEAAREWQEEQEIYRRLEEERKREP